MLDPLQMAQVSAGAVAAPGAKGPAAWRVIMPPRWRRAVLFAVTVAIGGWALIPLLRGNQAGAEGMMGFLALLAGLSSLWSG
jgi:hypothetical protein